MKSFLSIGTILSLYLIISCNSFDSIDRDYSEVGGRFDIHSIPLMRERVDLMEHWWKWKRAQVLPEIMRTMVFHPGRHFKNFFRKF